MISSITVWLLFAIAHNAISNKIQSRPGVFSTLVSHSLFPFGSIESFMFPPFFLSPMDVVSDYSKTYCVYDRYSRPCYNSWCRHSYHIATFKYPFNLNFHIKINGCSIKGQPTAWKEHVRKCPSRFSSNSRFRINLEYVHKAF